MNQSSDSQWAHQEPFDPMASLLPEEDFSNFIDLDNMDLNFQMFDSNGLDLQDGQQVSRQNRNGSLPDNPTNFNMEQYGDTLMMSSTMGEYSQAVHAPLGGTNGIDFRGQPSYQQPNGNPQGTPGHTYSTQFNIPPTPNSAEMYPWNMQYVNQQMDNQGQWTSEQQFHMRKNDAVASLTPLVSPHLPGSAHSLHMIPDHTMPGAYLSPLNSPAMRPHPSVGQYPAYTPSRTADSSLAGSPIDLNLEQGNDTTTSTDERPRKTRKKTASTKPSVPASRSRQNTGANQRRKDLSNLAPSGVNAAVDAQHSPKSHGGQPKVLQRASSKSNSPQPNTELIMAPPPKPGSVVNTPISLPGLTVEYNSGQPPATPASLMRLRQQQQSGNIDMSPSGLYNELSSPVSGVLGASMEDLRLPEAATPATKVNESSKSRIIISETKSVRDTPAPLAMSKSTGPQPILPSPAGSISTPKTETKGGRGSRKRNSTNTSLVSPAIRPKISPSIKPLLSDGSTLLNSDTHTLLLASKSNYQNIIEGTTLPGVNYPAELSTNLTSKRTSHKIAEQGRRNRINMALQEMQSLLPTSPTFLPASRKEDGSLVDGDVTMSNSPEDGSTSISNAKATDGGSCGESNLPAAGMRTPATPFAIGAQSNAGNSKAATVELAIDYIKHLNTTLADKESENEKLRAELKALKDGLDGKTEDVKDNLEVAVTGDAKTDEAASAIEDSGSVEDVTKAAAVPT